jgi:hypothetical protein
MPVSVLSMTLTEQLAEQLDWHWRSQLRPRLDGLTDEEYFWEPVPGMWSIRPAGDGRFTGDYTSPEPSPPPATTIAWLMAHVIVADLGARAASHFGAPPADYYTWPYAGTADEALRQLDTVYAVWNAGVRGLSASDLERPCGSAEGEWADAPMLQLVLHINREVIHHGAEMARLRDLYQWKA